jgi:hypothetical protein
MILGWNTWIYHGVNCIGDLVKLLVLISDAWQNVF